MMHFIKRNFKTVFLYVLAMGIIGTLLAYFMAENTYDYEEYYSLSEPLSTTKEDELSIQLNQEVNSQFNSRPAAFEYSAESKYLSLNIDSMSRSDISSIKNQFDNVLDDMGILYEDSVDVSINVESNITLKLLIIGVSLLLGVILGLIHGTLNKRIDNDEDVQYYLNEKTLGTF